MASRHGSRRKHKNKNLKKNILYAAGGVLGVLLIFAALFIPKKIEATTQCTDLGFKDSELLGDGCRIDEKYSFKNIVLIVGNTQNSPKPKITENLLKILSNSMAASGGTKLSVYSVAGTGRNIQDIKLSIKDYNDFDDFSNKIKKNLETVGKIITQGPLSNGAAYADTIIQGIEQLSNTGGALVIIGSGLSDSGIINFADGNLLPTSNNSDENRIFEEKVLNLISNTNQIPHMNLDSEISFYWIGLGDTVYPQEKISNKQPLKNIYKKLFECITGNPVPEGEIHFETLHSGNVINTNFTVKTTPVSNSGAITGVLDESQLSFEPDTNIFTNTDENELVNVLKKYVDHANSTGSSINIVGYVARNGCNGDRSKELALSRAEATKKFIVEKIGFSADRIYAYAAADLDSLSDECSTGYWDEELAKKNRIIKISA